MTTDEVEESTHIDELLIFFQGIIKILERWMKVMTSEEGDMVGPLIIDHLLKSIIIKLDTVFAVKDHIVDNADSDFAEKLSIMREACTNKLELQLTQFDMRRKEYEEQID
jgi:hypothetical protein